MTLFPNRFQFTSKLNTTNNEMKCISVSFRCLIRMAMQRTKRISRAHRKKLESIHLDLFNRIHVCCYSTNWMNKLITIWISKCIQVSIHACCLKCIALKGEYFHYKHWRGFTGGEIPFQVSKMMIAVWLPHRPKEIT